MNINKLDNIAKFVLSLFLCGILFGMVLCTLYKPNIEPYIKSFIDSTINTHNNVFLLNMGIISAVFVLSIMIIGLPIIYLYLFYEGISIGFTFLTFIKIYKLKGLVLYITYFISSKLVYILILLYYIIINTKTIKNIIINIIKKNNRNNYKLIIKSFYRYILINIVILINSFLIYLFSYKIFNYIYNVL